MKFTIDWLKNYVDIDGLLPEELAEKLTMLGLEVDGVINLFEELAPIKTARILSVLPHPEADKLQVCKVAVGDDELEIVCGAPNARKDLITAVALTGTVLPGDVKIKKSKVRGVVSNGMLCSEKELGLSGQSDGIIELPAGIDHGLSFIDATGLRDVQIEVDLTPNRSDCASVIGIAREVAGFLRKPLQTPVKDAAITTSARDFTVEVETPEFCPRYAARLIKNISIAPSPLWLRNRLVSVGLRPINNVVDITNFVMMEYGQPLHAFDFDKLAGRKIIVRTARNGEDIFTTLDGKERKINTDTLLICDSNRPVAIAGIMGGMNSEVTDTTTNILLESACFNDVSIRKTARRLKLSTDASYRFERGVDPEGTINAMNRAVQLLCELAGGHCPVGEGLDIYKGVKRLERLTLRVTKCNDLTGLCLSADTIVELLNAIAIRCERKDDDTLLVTPPSFRMDIEREADLIEEVARLYGYNNIPISLPAVNLSYPEQEKGRQLRKKTSGLLIRMGFSEAINYSFCSENHLDMMHLNPSDQRRRLVRLLNPLSEDQSVMRSMLLPGLLENVKRNISFQKTAIKLFEIGKVFFPQETEQQPIENTRLAGILSGDLYHDCSPLHFKSQNVDFLDIKGCVEQLLETLLIPFGNESGYASFHFPQETEVYADPEQILSLTCKNAVIGHLGKLQSHVVKGFGIKQDVFFFDIDFDALCILPALPKKFTPLPVYPSVRRDIALVVADTVSAGEILQSVRDSEEKLIEQSEIFDIYRGEKIEVGYKSVALSITYRSPNKTLTEKNVEKAHTKIVKKLTDSFSGHLREA